jgi:hypothetical protein
VIDISDAPPFAGLDEHALRQRASQAGYRAFAIPTRTGTQYALLARAKRLRDADPLLFRNLPAAIAGAEALLRQQARARAEAANRRSWR